MIIMEPEISAAILAGGSAKRLGGIVKPAISVGGQTILSRMLSVLGEIFREIIVVSNSREQFYLEYNLVIVPDIIAGKGPLGGIHSALKNASGRAVFVFAGDMPLIDKSLIISEIYHFNRQNPDVLVPRAGELIEPLHAIYSKDITESLEAYLSAGNSFAVRDFLQNTRTAFFEPDDPSRLKNAFLNINSPGDIVIAEEILSNGFS